jgi:hypothetical protein
MNDYIIDITIIKCMPIGFDTWKLIYEKSNKHYTPFTLLE